MTKHQGGTSTSHIVNVSAPPGSRTKQRPGRFGKLEIPIAASDIGPALSNRKVRAIVTVSRREVRRRVPSYKGKLLKFESLVKEDALRVLNVASSVTSLVMQPGVFAIPGSPRFRYTSDLRATMYGQDYFVEIKPADFQKTSHGTPRLRRVTPHFKTSQTPFIVTLDIDLRPPRLQEELKALLWLRQVPGRYDTTLDNVQWPPRQTQTAPPEVLRRWYGAQREYIAICVICVGRSK